MDDLDRWDTSELAVADGNYMLWLSCGHLEVEYDLGQDPPVIGRADECEIHGAVCVVDVAWTDG